LLVLSSFKARIEQRIVRNVPMELQQIYERLFRRDSDLHIVASWFETHGFAALLTTRMSDLILRGRSCARLEG
jgi:hypothetical protein